MLRTKPFLSVLGLMLLGWILEGLMLPVVPLIILARGGDALFIGLVTALYAIPSIALRPFIGRFIDKRGHEIVLRVGALLFAIGPLGYLFPGLFMAAASRFGQGSGWAMYGTATNVVLARLAPAHRRGEASGYSTTIRAVGLLIGPSIGLWLLGVGDGIVFLFAALLGAVGLLGTWSLPLSVRGASKARDSIVSEGQEAERRWYSRIFEPIAVPSMVIVAAFISSQMLFLVFAPIFVETVGAGAGGLALLYPAFGLTLALAPLVTSRLSDKVGRRASVAVGCGLASLGLAIGIVPGGMTTFVVAAVCVAAANSLVISAVGAATIDLAPPGRLGSAIATYTVGFQLAYGLGGALWGAVISIAGFPWPFVGAIGLQVLAAATAIRFIPGRPGGPAPTSPVVV